MRHGIFQHPMVIDTMLVYYGKQGTKACIPTASSPGENPIGALALVCTAVRTGLTVSLPFSHISTGRACIMHAHHGVFHQESPFIL